MANLVRCRECQGRKTEFGLGMIERKCTECEGIGSVSYSSNIKEMTSSENEECGIDTVEIEALEFDNHENENQSETVNNAPKRGRPKKSA
jgi:hypothetical protein